MSAIAIATDRFESRHGRTLEREPATLFDLPHGFACVAGELTNHDDRYSWSGRQYSELEPARAAAREALASIVAGRLPRRPAWRPARGATLRLVRGRSADMRARFNRKTRSWSVPFADRQYDAYVAATGREPRTIGQYLQSLGVTDPDRLERAQLEWTGRAAPELVSVTS